MKETALAGVYMDFDGLARLRAAAGPGAEEPAREAAQQFEAMFVQQMLKSMRASVASGGLFADSQAGLYRDMYDKQLSLELSKLGGLGIAEMVSEQLAGRTSADSGALGSLDDQQPQPDVEASDRPSGAIFAATGSAVLLDALWTTADARAALQSAPALTDAAPHSAHAALDTPSDPMIWNAPEDFVKTLWPEAQAVARKLGTQPQAVLAVAALETGWGKHVPRLDDGRSSNNLFGIKAGASWTQQKAIAATLEVEDGIVVKKHEPFRAYASPREAFSDFAALIQGYERYAPVLDAGSDPIQFAHALHGAGYATDPQYANKLISVMQSETMHAAVSGL